MAAWTLIPCLVALRAEFNAVSPNRDKGADGSIGDASHTSTSDHTPDEDSDALRDHDADSKNEVHALDIDSTGPWPEPGWFNATIEAIRLAEKRRWLDPNDRCRLKYIIWNKRIASQSSDFEWRAYTGASDHTDHAHFSGRYETACENDVSPWGVEDDVLNDADKKWITAEFTRIVDARADAIAEEVLVKTRFLKTADNPADPKSYQRNLGDLAGDTWAAVMRGKTLGGDALPAAGVFGQINAKLDAVSSVLADLAADADGELPTKAEILAAIAAEFRTIVRDGVA